jgi:ArsR family transcriptional regulator, lead/cadmium/zinc/bismuth-responsive transcriptional repressor
MKEIEYRAATLLECMGEPVRFQILRHLQNGPKAVCELARLTKRHQTTICHHLSTLRSAHLVRYRNHNQFTFYELKPARATQLIELAVRCAQDIKLMPDQAH